MKRTIKPARKFGGTLSVPGDKSIAHRAALLSILSNGPIVARNFPDNADCRSSLNAAAMFGVRVEQAGSTVTLHPPAKLSLPPDAIIDCGNSGTTARLLAGLIAGSGLEATLTGDESLRRRPMKRVIDPLTAMGASLAGTENRLPLKVVGSKLLPFEYTLKVPSAQVKSALLLAGLASKCSVVVREETPTRDHTENVIEAIGEGITVREIKPVVEPDPVDPRRKRTRMPESFKREVALSAQTRIDGGDIDIPGDISTASFFLAAAAISGKSITVTNVGLNPLRTEFLDHLKAIGCTVAITDKTVVSGEARGNVTVVGSQLKSRKLHGDTIVGLIDEIPMVAVMAAFADGTTIIRDAAELRVKESDRLMAVSENLRRMGVKCGLLADGLVIEGRKEITGADIQSYGDHRIAMAFSIAALFAVGPSTIDEDNVVAVSCPQFYDLLSSIAS
ncbi:MAG: 3-phosphoshikimate 1-carboxyvinyltransferase [Candidatus Zixiibacteriota bacterium]